MPKITPKPTEVIQAQTAAFLSEHPLNYGDRAELLNNLGSLAAGPLEGAWLTFAEDVNRQNGYGQWKVIPAGTSRLVASVNQYNQFMRDKGGASHEDIRGRADLLSAYEEFSPTINALKRELATAQDPDKHPAFIGSGVSSRAFAVQRDGRELVAIIPRFEKFSQITVDTRIAGAIRARGIPHLEQMVAASYDDGVTISERLPGRSLNNLTAEEIQAIPQSHVKELLDTARRAHDNRVGIDFVQDGSNFVYDLEAGFGIVDLHFADDKRNFTHMTDKLAEILASRGETPGSTWLREQAKVSQGEV